MKGVLFGHFSKQSASLKIDICSVLNFTVRGCHYVWSTYFERMLDGFWRKNTEVGSEDLGILNEDWAARGYYCVKSVECDQPYHIALTQVCEPLY